MKLVSYNDNQSMTLGIFHDNQVYNLHKAALLKGYKDFPATMKAFLEAGDSVMQFAKELDKQIKSGKLAAEHFPSSQVEFLAPVPQPTPGRLSR